MHIEDTTEDQYRAASRLTLEAERLIRPLVASYWESLRDADDLIDWLNENALSIERDGRIILTVGGPKVWLSPDGRMMYQEFAARPVGAYPPDGETSGKLAALRELLEDLYEELDS